MAWRPTAQPGVDLKALTLSPLQGYVVSRLDGASDVAALARATGLPAERVSSLLDELVALGAVAPDVDAMPAARHALADEPEPPTDVHPALQEVGPEALADVLTVPEAGLELADVPTDARLEALPPEESEAVTATHRELFETKLHPMSVDERVACARAAVEPELSALCFDPVPQVIVAVLDNPRAGAVHARLVARHHRNPAGLDAMAARATFAADAAVRRGLLQNPILPASLYRRLWGTRRLLDQFNVTISREVSDQTKRTAREAMRQRFATGPAEDRVELIVKTEGRCLQALTGLPIDSKTTALLCGRTYGSSFLVQNLARWSAAPPQLVAHLQRQEIVRRSAMLKALLERHPNAPSAQV